MGRAFSGAEALRCGAGRGAAVRGAGAAVWVWRRGGAEALRPKVAGAAVRLCGGAEALRPKVAGAVVRWCGGWAAGCRPVPVGVGRCRPVAGS
ncbi:hypothetical protein Misp01_00520 [Microtetraspora sp. NBRC 13810]|nr:hypothetical protein Misp01_00520 [Microtetraspora sp. NBRC 13810]